MRTWTRILALAALVAAAAGGVAPAAVDNPVSTGIDVSVVGLEDGIHRLQEFKGNQQAAQGLIALALLQTVGRRDAPVNGRSRLDYHVEISPEAHVLVNGADVTMLMAASGLVRQHK